MSRKFEATPASRKVEPAKVASRKLEAKENDTWEKMVVEIKATKRQWADVEDSDEEAQAPNVVVV